MSCWFASARRRSAVSAPNAGDAIASSASSSLSPQERMSAAQRPCCAAAARVLYSAASCAIEAQASCSAAIVWCAESSAPTCCSTPNSTERAVVPVLSPGRGPS